MGRRSLAGERKVQIIEALATVIREEGYEAATLERVAAQAGVQRTLIRHYFGNRDELVGEALVHIAGKYLQDCETAMARLPAARSLAALVDYLFGGPFNQRPDDEVVIDALIAASGHSEAARSAIVRMYRTFEETVATLLRKSFPSRTSKEIREIAYAMVCLAEQHSMMRSLGIGGLREAGLKRVARTLIETLATRQATSRKGVAA